MSRSTQVMLEEARLARRASLNQEIYIQFQKQFELAKIEEMDDQSLLQIVQNAEIPIQRIKPKRKQIIVIAFVCGIFAGTILVLFLNMVGNFRSVLSRVPGRDQR